MDNQTFFKNYESKMVNIQKVLLDFLENENTESYDNFSTLINNQLNRENEDEMKSFLHLISKISNNHYQTATISLKIEQILKNYENDIKQNFSNYTIFQIFKNNKRLLLYLFQEKIIIPDKSLSCFISTKKYYEQFYPHFFFREFQSFFDQNLQKRINLIGTEDLNNEPEYNKKRKIGENDNYICKLIRNDSVDEFASYVKEKNIQLKGTIDRSIYETHPLFLKYQKMTLIEYAAFFGSIQIIQYLHNNNVQLEKSLWIYAIHSNNAELINFLEINHVEMNEKIYFKCFEESIKCHHRSIMNSITNKFEKNAQLINACLHYYNFIEMNKNNYSLNNMKDIFFYLCKYDYVSIVKYFVDNKEINLNVVKIHARLFYVISTFYL